jgi:hypothetical protein
MISALSLMAPKKKSFVEVLQSMPNVGLDADFVLYQLVGVLKFKIK